MSISDVKGDHMDILFKNDDFVFSYRVGGILIHNEKILLQRPKNDDYAIIGGHYSGRETHLGNYIFYTSYAVGQHRCGELW